MEKFFGKAIFSGVSIGRVFLYNKQSEEVVKREINNVQLEVERYEMAREFAIKELNFLEKKVSEEVGQVEAQIFEVHAMMLEDDDYNESVLNIINEGVNAEYAVDTTGHNFAEIFSNMDDDYFKARAIDVKDISKRLVRILSGNNEKCNMGDEPVIVVAKDLAPSETVQFEKDKLLAFVTELGSSNSHTAILARTMNIPALINIEIKEEWNGKMGIVDGYTGTFYIDPSEELLNEYKKKKEADGEKLRMLQELKGKENITLSGKTIKIYANIANVSDIDSVIQNDAGGIGLFRSEFLYLEKDNFPTEEEQFEAYKKVAKSMGGKKVIIRTLDIGADKQASYFNLDHEENPAMGYRAIRICLDRVDIFKTQLRALYRASAFGNIAIMYPMIISVNEVRKAKEIAKEVREELIAEGVSIGTVEQGIMIETPAAVMISDLLAKEVDFFSIGTNDLTQYTLAIDRQNSKLDNIYDAHHEAVLRSIKMVVDNAHKEGIWAGICGELGADLSLTEKFLEMGVDELSVSPTFILSIRKVVRETK